MLYPLKFILVSLFSIFYSYLALSQFEEYPMVDSNYVDHIKTIQINFAGNPNSYPYVGLNKGSLEISFDDWNNDHDYYYYIYHCDRHWNISNISELEYLNGFNGEEIENYQPSSITKIHYTHYKLSLPNEDTRLQVSGNYLLFVADEDENPIFSKRFVVYENRLITQHDIEKTNTLNRINSGQSVVFSLSNVSGDAIDSPFESLECHVLQNGRWDDRLVNIVPQFQTGQIFKFDFTNQLTLPGHNEFRNFDFRSLDFTTLFVFSIDIYNDSIDVLLKKQYNRNRISYIFDNDNNGKFLIRNERWDRDDYTSEYGKVVFNLMDDTRYEGDIYILGAFNDFKPYPQYKMEYYEEREMYVGSAPFKQGYYDYMFGILNEDGTIDYETLEGSHNLAENDYIVFTYHRAYNRDYDEVISFRIINTAIQN